MRVIGCALLFALATSAAAACGGGVASNTDCAPIPIHCATGCPNGVVGANAPSCVNGQWVCPAVSGICAAGDASFDASADASPDAPIDAPADGVVLDDAGRFTCGPRSCAAAAEYCEEASGGPPPPPDSGSGVGYSCPSFPVACAVNRTCACLRANNVCSGGLVDCQETGGAVTVSCAFP